VKLVFRGSLFFWWELGVGFPIGVDDEFILSGDEFLADSGGELFFEVEELVVFIFVIDFFQVEFSVLLLIGTGDVFVEGFEGEVLFVLVELFV
jgi:hypothetical protein